MSESWPVVSEGVPDGTIEISRQRRENNPSVMAKGHDSFPYTGKPLDGTQSKGSLV